MKNEKDESLPMFAEDPATHPIRLTWIETRLFGIMHSQAPHTDTNSPQALHLLYVAHLKANPLTISATQACITVQNQFFQGYCT